MAKQRRKPRFTSGESKAVFTVVRETSRDLETKTFNREFSTVAADNLKAKNSFLPDHGLDYSGTTTGMSRREAVLPTKRRRG